MYPAKLLLFGEYSILTGSQALSVPFEHFAGDWAMTRSNSRNVAGRESNDELKKMLRSWKQENITDNIPEFDLNSFENELSRGLYFCSDIPSSCGLGSSGAVIAAVFDRFVRGRLKTNGTEKLIRKMALMENHFHGTSSGIDPLVSYLKLPLRINNDGSILPQRLNFVQRLMDSGFFMFRSPVISNTRDLVDGFMEKCRRDAPYFRMMKETYIPLNDRCVDAWLSGTGFYPLMRDLTALQISMFGDMIPPGIMELMQHGLRNDMYFLKLCGSGGGGYFLGFSENLKETEKHIRKQHLAAWESIDLAGLLTDQTGRYVREGNC